MGVTSAGLAIGSRGYRVGCERSSRYFKACFPGAKLNLSRLALWDSSNMGTLLAGLHPGDTGWYLLGLNIRETP